MSQKNHFYQSEASSFGGYKNPNVTFSCQSSAGTLDRSLNNSPCSSNTTLVDDEAQARGLTYGRLHQASVQETVPGVQSMKSDLNANATTFIPSRFVEYGYFPPPAHTPVAWVRILDAGMLASNIALPTVLAQSGPWSFDTLRDLAQLFCWEILAKANIVDFGPEAAFFAREVRDALRLHHSEWASSCFVAQLQTAVLEHFKSFWCSLNNPHVISPRRKLEMKRWNVALDLSRFMADLFAFGLIQPPIMHDCLGILLHEMVSVEHVRVVQSMIKRAGPRLWQTADAHERRQEFTRRFMERTALVPDNASLIGREDSNENLPLFVAQADNIISLIGDWQARRPECPPLAVKSVWGSSGLIL
ncbi:hypothetical protein BDR06DRAFT_1010311 [Suillus hirtellus]|nr:hypothetical protein BDR06DRAFT_1010311 [Suillus hirtellus]